MRTAALLVVASFLAPACRADRPEAERVIERSYAAYESIAIAMANADDCATGIAAALSEIERRRADLERAFAIQRDPERLAAARPALEARKDRFIDIAAQLDTALTHCESTPGSEAVRSALAP